MFPSPCILQHYVQFDTHTKTMLEKNLFMGSFSGFIGHLVHHRGIILVSLNMFSLPYVVQIVALTFLGCWALIALVLVIHF
jgi:hypothetical protein